MKQGDTLSPTLFGIFINDLAKDIKKLKNGIQVNDENISILLYADDIVLLAPDETSLQKQLDFLNGWCRRWRMSVNEDKSQIVHFRPQRFAQTRFKFMLGTSNLKIVQTYKYLGVHLNEHLDFSVIADRLASGASRALGLLRFKLRSLKECRYSTFTKLYTSCVVPILDYGAAVWGYKFQAGA